MCVFTCNVENLVTSIAFELLVHISHFVQLTAKILKTLLKFFKIHFSHLKKTSAACLFLMDDVIRDILHTVFAHLWPDSLTLYAS